MHRAGITRSSLLALVTAAVSTRYRVVFETAISRVLASPLSPNGRVTPLGTFTFTRLP